MSTIEVEKSAVPALEPVRWSIPLVLLACVLLAFFDKVSVAALFSDPGFQQDLGIGFDSTLLGMLMTSFLLSYGISSIVIGRIGDVFNPIKVLVILLISWSILMLWMGLMDSYMTLMFARILLGIAQGPLFALAFKIVRQSFPAHLQARATMLWLLGTPLGAGIGFPVIIVIAQHIGWRWAYFVMAIAAVPVILAVIYYLRHIKFTPKVAVTPTVNINKVSLQSETGVFNYLIKNTHFWVICLFNIAFLTYLWGMNGWLPTYLIQGKGLHVEIVGYLSALPFVGMLIGEIFGAWISDRLDRRALICFISLLGAGICLGGVVYFHNIYFVIAAMSFSMMMWGLGAPNVYALLGKVVVSNVSATAGGIFNGIGNLAGALAPTIMGILIGLNRNMDNGLIFLVGMAMVGSLVLLPIIKRY